MKLRFIILVLAGLLSPVAARADSDHCGVCGNLFGEKVYIMTDEVTREKVQICYDCSVLPDACFVCGLPVKKDFTSLPDGRRLCARDARNAVLDNDEAKKIYEEVHDALDRLFSRFLTFPVTNVTTTIVDRVNLLELFKVPGNDYACPNVLGYINTKTNRGGLIRHKISLMGALPRAEFKAVCSHELSHAWQAENVPVRRKKTLGHDANEGFCELVAYLLMNSESEIDEMKAIRRNAYTRGQIDLFIEAESRFGFNQIVDWMQYGDDAVLHKDDLSNVRRISIPRPTAKPVAGSLSSSNYPPQKAAVFDVLTLKAILWSKAHPMATINNHTFEVGDTSKVKLGSSNVTVTCISIREDAVQIKVADSPEVRELRVRAK
jgi:hypothetical protein